MYEKCKFAKGDPKGGQIVHLMLITIVISIFSPDDGGLGQRYVREE